MLMSTLTAAAVAGASLFASVPMAGDGADKAIQVLIVVLTIVQIFLGLGG